MRSHEEISTRLQAKDPDLINLRKAARAALVAVPLFALLKVALDQGPLASFAFFGCFVGLVFADFGGPPRPRAMAYAAMIVVGDLLIVIGLLLSDSLVGSAATMFVVVFAVCFAAIFGGYLPAFLAPATLAYSLAVLDPLNNVAIDARLLGWTVGGAAAMLAALLLWPVNQRLKLRQTLAQASGGLAEAMESGTDRTAAEDGYRKAADALAEARRKASTPLRPAGPTSRHVGLLHLVLNLEQAADMTRQFLDRGWPPKDNDEQLAAACTRTFRRIASALLERSDPAILSEDLKALNDCLLDRHRCVQSAMPQTFQSSSDVVQRMSETLAAMRRSFPIMALAHTALWVDMAAAAALGLGQALTPLTDRPELTPLTDRPAALVRRARHILARGLDPDGVIFRNSVRAAAAMTLAVVLAQVVPLEHRFWVTLATLLVLRSSATSTSATVLQAMAGTLTGFVVAAVILTLFDDNPTVLWFLLPCCVFLAAYTPNAVSFMVGQVSFTVAFVLLFTLIDDVGLLTDVARVETVGIGATASAVMALIFWPRGARDALAHAIAVVYRTSSESLRHMATDPAASRRNAEIDMQARRRADEAFGIALGERGQQIDARAWIHLFRAPNLVHSLVTQLLPPPSPGAADRFCPALAVIHRKRDEVAARLAWVAERLDSADAPPTRDEPAARPTDASADDLIPLLTKGLDSTRPPTPQLVADARLLIAWNYWVTCVDDYVAAAGPALDQVAAASRPRAWLRWSELKAKTGPAAPT